MTAPQHTVSVVAQPASGPVTLAKIKTLDLTMDLLELGDPFTFDVPFTREAWAATRADTAVQIFIDDVRVMTGLIDDRDRAIGKDGSTIAVVGRDRAGRLRDESAPFFLFEGMTLEELATKLVSPWFKGITFSNAENRDLIRGRGRRKARAGVEPIFSADETEHKVSPGATRAAVLEVFLRKAGLLAWSTADGKTFFIGLPNQTQAPQWNFLIPKPGSSRWLEGNVESAQLRESVGERYSKIAATCTGEGDEDNYGPNVRRFYAEAVNGDGPDGTGEDFQYRKVLVLTDDEIKSAAEAKKRAEEEMRVRDATGRNLDLNCTGFGQALSGNALERPAIFATDTIARVVDEEIEEQGDWLLTRVNMRQNRDEGQVSALSMVPRGTELRAA